MKIRNRTLIRCLAWLLAGAFRLLFATVRVRIRCGPQGAVPYGRWGTDRFLMCMWHDAIAGTIFSGRSVDLAALVSRHADGEYVAEAIDVLGIKPIRGSSGHGGAAAMREMMEAAREHHIAIATDGPRGPRRVVKDGIIFLASVSGRGIVPVVFAARSYWSWKGRWTDLVIPRPFTTVWLMSTPPLFVPPGLSREQLGPYREQLQHMMDELSARCEAIARGELPDPPEALIVSTASASEGPPAAQRAAA